MHVDFIQTVGDLIRGLLESPVPLAAELQILVDHMTWMTRRCLDKISQEHRLMVSRKGTNVFPKITSTEPVDELDSLLERLPEIERAISLEYLERRQTGNDKHTHHHAKFLSRCVKFFQSSLNPMGYAVAAFVDSFEGRLVLPDTPSTRTSSINEEPDTIHPVTALPDEQDVPLSTSSRTSSLSFSTPTRYRGDALTSSRTCSPAGQLPDADSSLPHSPSTLSLGSPNQHLKKNTSPTTPSSRHSPDERHYHHGPSSRSKSSGSSVRTGSTSSSSASSASLQMSLSPAGQQIARSRTLTTPAETARSAQPLLDHPELSPAPSTASAHQDRRQTSNKRRARRSEPELLTKKNATRFIATVKPFVNSHHRLLLLLYPKLAQHKLCGRVMQEALERTLCSRLSPILVEWFSHLYADKDKTIAEAMKQHQCWELTDFGVRPEIVAVAAENCQGQPATYSSWTPVQSPTFPSTPKTPKRELTDTQVLLIASDMRRSLRVHTNTWLWQSYPHSFTGSAAVAWLEEQNLVDSKGSAVMLCCRMLSLKAVEHVSGSLVFKNDKSQFFRFTKFKTPRAESLQSPSFSRAVESPGSPWASTEPNGPSDKPFCRTRRCLNEVRLSDPNKDLYHTFRLIVLACRSISSEVDAHNEQLSGNGRSASTPNGVKEPAKKKPKLQLTTEDMITVLAWCLSQGSVSGLFTQTMLAVEIFQHLKCVSMMGEMAFCMTVFQCGVEHLYSTCLNQLPQKEHTEAPVTFPVTFHPAPSSSPDNAAASQRSTNLRSQSHISLQGLLDVQASSQQDPTFLRSRSHKSLQGLLDGHTNSKQDPTFTEKEVHPTFTEKEVRTSGPPPAGGSNTVSIHTGNGLGHGGNNGHAVSIHVKQAKNLP
eukprot:g61612.t1